MAKIIQAKTAVQNSQLVDKSLLKALIGFDASGKQYQVFIDTLAALLGQIPNFFLKDQYIAGTTVIPTDKTPGLSYLLGAGTYTEFGNFNTTADPATGTVPANELWIVTWNGTKWNGIKLPINLSGYLQKSQVNVNGGVAGYEALMAINNQTTYGIGSSTDVTTTATQIANSYVKDDGSIGTSNIFKILKVKVSKGDVISLLANGGGVTTSDAIPFGMMFLFSDSDVFISKLVNRTTAAGTLETYTAIATQDGYMYCNARVDVSSLVPSVSVSKSIISKIFAEKSAVDANTNAIAALQQSLSGALKNSDINIPGGVAGYEALMAINNQTIYGTGGSTDVTVTATQIANSYVKDDGSIGTGNIFKILKVKVSKGDVITLSANGGNTVTSESIPFGMMFLFSDSDVFISKLVNRTTAAGTLETYTAVATQDGYMYCNARIDVSSLVPSVSASKSIISKIFAEKSAVDANTNAIAALQQQASVQIPATWYSDGYINRSGAYVATSDGNYTRTGYVPISDNSSLTIEGAIVTQSTMNNVSYYSAQSEGGYISGQYFNGTGKYTLTIPTGAKYLRFSNRISGGGAFTLTISTKDLVKSLYSQSNNAVPNQFAMPAYLDCPIGLNTDIFFDCISQEPDFSNGGLVITGYDSVSRIQKYEKKLRYNPLSTSPDSVSVTFKRVDKQVNDLYSKSIIFRKIGRSGGTGATKNICIAGDSLIEIGSACVDEIYKLLAADGDYTINQIGTRILSNPWGVKHEGRRGWSWTHYVNPAYEAGVGEYNDASNAFMIGGKLDFKAYMTNNFPTLSGIDIFYIGLGTNDVQSGLFLATDAQVDAIINNAKTFLNALISDYPNCKIILGMPAVGAPVFSDTRNNEAYFRYSIQKVNMAYVDNFDNGKYNSNLTCVMYGAYTDRYDGYLHTDEAANDYITNATIRRWTDSIHPLEAQYRSWGRGIYGKIRAILNGLL